MMTDAVVVTRERSVATVRLNRPQSRNALSPDVKSGLAAAIPHLMADPGVGCIVITGTDDAFCSGGDLSAMDDRAAPAVLDRMQASHRWTRMLLTGDIPVIAAVNGPAAGAGFSLAMLCDVVVVSEGAYFQPGFPAVGAVPDLGLALTLPRAVGMARAREILLTNRRVAASEAVAIGLAAQSCPHAEVAAAAASMAHTIADGPRLGNKLTKALLSHAYGPADSLLEQEAMAQAVAFGTRDFAEGVTAFLERRKPRFA